MNHRILLGTCLLAVAGHAKAANVGGSDVAKGEHVQAVNATEPGQGVAPANGLAMRVADVSWEAPRQELAERMAKTVRTVLSDAAVRHGLQLGDDAKAVQVSTATRVFSRPERLIVAELTPEKQEEQCPEKGPDVLRMIAGVAGLGLGLSRDHAASMIGSGATAGRAPNQWQRFDHLPPAQRVLCGRGEWVVETKVSVREVDGQPYEFVVRSAAGGGLAPIEGQFLVLHNGDAIVRELKALQSGACDRAIRCEKNVAQSGPTRQP
jgi:hypothetical protein